MSVFRVSLFASLLMIGAFAQADILPCATQTVTGILGTTCSIGDKTFQFGFNTFDSEVVTGNPHPGTISSTPLSTDNLIFTPDASNPNSPGFVISGARGFTFSGGGGDPGTVMDFRLDYTVGITNPSSGAVIIGTTVTIADAQASETDPSNDEIGATVTQFLKFPGPCYAAPSAGIGFLNGVKSDSGSKNTDDTSCAPVLLADASAQFGVGGVNGSASFTNAGYYIDEKAAANVPEPSTFMLLASGMTLAAGLRRRLG